MVLWNKKNDDRLWMAEVAAMQACSHSEFPFLGTSGIVLAGEDNDLNHNGLMKASASESTTSHGSLDTNQGIVESICLSIFFNSSLLFLKHIRIQHCCYIFCVNLISGFKGWIIPSF